TSPALRMRDSAAKATRRNASRSMPAKVGTASSAAMSSFSPMSAAARSPRSRNEFVAALLGHENAGVGRILLDLLPKAVDVRLERVRCDVGVVAPDLGEQHLARHHLLACAVEK